MALNLNYGSGGGSGNETMHQIVKWNSRSGRMTLRTWADGAATETDCTATFKAVFDFEQNLSTGWINFDTGGAPDFAVVPFGDPVPPCPSDKHRAGFRLLMKLHPSLGGTIRELASTAKSCLRGLDEAHNLYLAGLKDNAGKLPVFTLDPTPLAITTGEGARKSTNYCPVFILSGWASRPSDLTFAPRASTAAPAPKTPPTTGSTPVSAPSMGIAVAEDDFG